MAFSEAAAVEVKRFMKATGSGDAAGIVEEWYTNIRGVSQQLRSPGLHRWGP